VVKADIIMLGLHPFNIKVEGVVRQAQGGWDGVTETTSNQELSIFRIAMNLGRKCTPAKAAPMPFLR